MRFRRTLDNAMAFNHLRLDRDDFLATITLARPDRRNALSREMIGELTRAFSELGTDRTAHAVVLAAEGPAFCSGHDIAEMKGRDAAFYRALFEECVALMERIQRVPQPVVAAVQGLATAAGCQLAASCDLAVAAESAGFATPGVKIGFFCTTPMVALTRAIGRKRALEMLFTGRVVPAREAAEWGLVNRVVPDGKSLEAAQELARQIAAAAPFTLALGKQAFYTQIDLDQPKAYAYAQEVMSLNAVAAGAQEGFCAFLEKRPPVWRES